MFGVVLWSDGRAHKAVIWCEDHGELAYFDAAEHPGAVDLDMEPGDLVRFEVTRCDRLRRVRNPRLVAEQQYPSLAVDLKAARPAAPATRAEAPEDRARSAVIIPFVAEQRRRASEAAAEEDQRLSV
ncbi:hypothetical protein [Pseudooceanicola sp.]|jgi:hypothetical protein|uniref:hypothetical protein n=1 Tax=Pseudooceanicola sp. TaxID=1914328 RepID=UPI00405A14E3